MINLRERLETLETLFARYEHPLTAEQGQEATQLMRNIEHALEHLPKGGEGGNPFIEAAIAQVQEGGKRPVMFVDWMNAFYLAQERTSDLLLQCIAFAPHCTSQEYTDLKKRRAIVGGIKKLQEVLIQIPAFASPVTIKHHPDYLQVLPEVATSEEGV